MRRGGGCRSMVRICTGEVWVRSSGRVGGRLLIGDDECVLGIACGVVGGEVERLEVVVVGFDFGTDADRVSHRPKIARSSFSVLISGCSAPSSRCVPGRVMSIASESRAVVPVDAPACSRRCSISAFSVLKRCPISFFASADADFNQTSLMALRRPCSRPSHLSRKVSTASGVASPADEVFHFAGDGGKCLIEFGFAVAGQGGDVA